MTLDEAIEHCKEVTKNNDCEEDDIELIHKTYSKMDSKQRKKMMHLLKLSFDELFDEKG